MDMFLLRLNSEPEDPIVVLLLEKKVAVISSGTSGIGSDPSREKVRATGRTTIVGAP
jgi:hypothetical protein